MGHTSYTPFDVPYFWSNVSRMEDVHWDIPGVLAAKILGGCGVHNAMLYVRALERDIVSWTENHPDWQWEDIVKVYNAAETFTGNESEYHGYHGPIMTGILLFWWFNLIFEGRCTGFCGKRFFAVCRCLFGIWSSVFE